MQRLVDAGNTVVVIEHHLDVIKVADYVIDMGPEGGPHGGEIVAAGTPEQVAKEERSHTGRYLRAVLRSPSLDRGPSASQRQVAHEGVGHLQSAASRTSAPRRPAAPRVKVHRAHLAPKARPRSSTRANELG